MAENTLPKKNTAFTFYTSLVDSGSRPDLRASATLATGDVQVSTDGGAFGNIDTLPVITPASGVAIKVVLSTGEMNGDNVTVKFIDAAGGEWDDQLIEIRPATRKAEDLAFPTTSGRSLDITATGAAGIDWGNVENKTTVNDLTQTDIQLCDTVTTNTDVRGTDSAALASVLGAAVGADISADIAAVKAETVLIVADTNELQTDWTDAGRLDAILDEILVDTGEIGTAGIGLSNIPWNASWDTEVESEVADALAAINLDHLVFSALDTDWETTVHLDSVIGYIASDGTGTGTGTGVGSGFDRTFHSLEILRNWINDVLNVNTIILPGQEAPALAPTTTEAIAWLYKMMRNRKDQTATLFQLYADNESTVDAKATVSDDATTAIVQELVTGP